MRWAPESLRGDIVFEDVGFRYEEEKPVLEGFDLRVKQGEKIALVGPTGAGKSTIVNLVCRFYEPTSGRILVNGKDYRDWTLHGIHSRIGVVLQTPHLFSGTIRENVRYGRLEASDEEVERAAAHGGRARVHRGAGGGVREPGRGGGASCCRWVRRSC